MSELLKRIRYRQLGATKANVQRHLQEIDKGLPVDQTTMELLTATVGRELQRENSDNWCKAEAEGDFDWDQFFEFVMTLIEMLIPLIVKKRQQPT